MVVVTADADADHIWGVVAFSAHANADADADYIWEEWLSSLPMPMPMPTPMPTISGKNGSLLCHTAAWVTLDPRVMTCLDPI